MHTMKTIVNGYNEDTKCSMMTKLPSPISGQINRREARAPQHPGEAARAISRVETVSVGAINHDYYYLLSIIIIVLPRLPLPENAKEKQNNVWSSHASFKTAFF